MKTFSKVLSLLIVVVMCLGLVGTSAYALELDPGEPSGDSFGGGFDLEMGAPADQGGFDLDGGYSSQPEQSVGGGFDLSESAGSQDAGFNLDGSAEEPVVQVPEENEESALQMDETLTFNSAAGVIATVGSVGCKTVNDINNAIANGGTLTLVAAVNGDIIINKPTTIKLNKQTLGGTLKIYSSLSIEGEGTVNSTFSKMDGGSITLYGGTYSDSTFTKYIASGYTRDGNKVVPKNPASSGAIALVNGKDCFSLSDLNDMLGSSSGTVKLNSNVSGDIIFRYGGSLDLNGKTVSGNVMTYGSLSISDSMDSGKITGTVSAPSGSVSITGGGFDNEPISSFIANGYIYDTASKRVKPIGDQNEARIGNRFFKTMAQAIADAQPGETVVALERVDLQTNYPDVTINKNLTIQLGSNGFGTVTVNNARVNIIGGFVDNLVANNNAVVNTSGTRIGTATPDATSTINTSGSGIGGAGTGTTGGSGSGTGAGGSGIAYGSASVYNTPYLKFSSGNPVYFQPVASGAFEGFAYFKSGATKGGTAVGSGSYRFSYDQRMILDEGFLNSLTDGDYDLYGYVTTTSGSRSFTFLGTFVVYTDSPQPTTSWWLTPDYSKWYTGEDPLVFESNMFDKNVIGKKIIPLVRYGTNGTPTRTLSYEQFWEFDGNGYFMLGKNFLNSLSADQTYYLQVVDANNPSVNYTNIVRFRLGPTLKAIDTDKHVIGSTKNLRFLASEAVSAVYVGNIQLTSDADYALWNGGRTVVLSSEFLNQRTPGNTYTLKVLTYSGETASTTFQILTTSQASSSPRTGDTSNIGLWSAFLLLSGTAIVVLVPKLRKHEM